MSTRESSGSAAEAPAPFVTDHVWLPSEVGNLACHVTQPADPARLIGVCLLLPAIGYAYLSGYGSMRALAEQLAEHGVATLRVDYHGTGNSSGSGLESDSVGAWARSVDAAYSALRSSTDLPLGVVGFQLGGLLALRSRWPRSFTVLWEPPPSGHRFVAGLRLLGQTLPDLASEDKDGGLAVGGFPFPTQSLRELETWTPADAHDRLGDVLALLDSPAPQLLSALERKAASVRVLPAPTPSVLQAPAEEARPPYLDITEVVAWVIDHLDTTTQVVEPIVVRGARPCAHHEGTVESTVRVGRLALHAIHAQPLRTVPSTAETALSRTVTVFLNSGSEMNIGSGRAWLEYARNLAAAGFETLRLDWTGWARARGAGRNPGDPMTSAASRKPKTSSTCCGARARTSCSSGCAQAPGSP